MSYVETLTKVLHAQQKHETRVEEAEEDDHLKQFEEIKQGEEKKKDKGEVAASKKLNKRQEKDRRKEK